MTSSAGTYSNPSRRGARPGDWILHPFAFTLFPLVSLLAYNLQEIPANEATRAMLGALLACALALGLARLLTGDWLKAGLITSTAVLIFFSYGRLYPALKLVHLAGETLGRHRYLLPASAILFAAVTVWIARSRRNLAPLTRWLNIVALIALALPLLSILSQTISLARQGDADPGADITSVHLQKPQPPLPDVYYIILDGYARSDYMQSEVGYDNSDFIDGLERLGFYVAENSHANYAWTAFSLSSSLNMSYLQDLGIDFKPWTYPGAYTDSIRHSQVRRLLEGIGYRTVAMRSGYLPTEITDASIYLDPLAGPGYEDDAWYQLGAFESLALNTTAAMALWDIANLPAGDDSDRAPGFVPFLESKPLNDQATIDLAAFENLKNAPDIKGPKFVFAHIILPHSPYLFGPDGSRVYLDSTFTFLDASEDEGLSDPEERQRYRDQAVFTSRLALETLEAIVEQSDVPPIILVQSDHGASRRWGKEQRLSILNAIRLPAACASSLHPDITPVNSFRIVFNCAFGASLPILQDQSFDSRFPRTSDFEFVPFEFDNSESEPHELSAP